MTGSGMGERRVAVGGGELTYVHGGEGPLVVLTHALGPEAWGPLEALAGSCSVAVPVWSRCAVDIGSRLELAWFGPLVRDMGFERATLCVWSMSGPTGIEFAAEGSPALERLVLVDVAGLGGDLPPLRLGDWWHLALTRLMGRPTRGLVRIMWRHWVHSPELDTGPLIEATHRFFRPQPGALFGPPEEDEEAGEGESLADLLSMIEVPTLVLTGRHSTLLGPEDARAAAKRLPRGRVVVFEHSGHALQLEEPGRFQEVVAAFVGGSGV